MGVRGGGICVGWVMPVRRTPRSASGPWESSEGDPIFQSPSRKGKA